MSKKTVNLSILNLTIGSLLMLAACGKQTETSNTSSNLSANTPLLENDRARIEIDVP